MADTGGYFLMKKLLVIFCFIIMTLFTVTAPLAVAHAAEGTCGKNRTLFGLPTWYKYLQFDTTNKNCDIEFSGKVVNADGTVSSKFSFKDFYLILFAVLEILLRLAGVIAVVFVTVGGFKYVVARGNPDNLVAARRTIINALIGVVIAILASEIVGFIAARLAE